MNRLLSINSYHYRRGGSDAVYLDHAELFKSHGWDNRFFSMKHPKNLPSEDERYFIEMVDFEYSDSIGSKLSGSLSTIYNFEAVAKVRNILDEYNPNIAHVHCAYHHITPSIFPELSKQGVPIVLTAHDLKVLCPAYKMMNAGGICERCKTGSVWNVLGHRCVKNSFRASLIVGMEAALYRQLDTYRKHISMIIAPSKFYRNKFLEWGWPAERIVHVPNFSAPADIRFIQNYTSPITYFGRLAPEKGLVTLIKAAARSGIKIDIVGTGPSYNELAKLIVELDAPVSLKGRLDGDALWEKIGQSAAVVLPSEWYENGPMSIIEAFYLERPVIGADIGGIPELIRDSGGGWLYESGSVAELSNLLIAVSNYSNAELAQRGAAGAAYARAVYSKERYFDAMSSIYRRIMI